VQSGERQKQDQVRQQTISSIDVNAGQEPTLITPGPELASSEEEGAGFLEGEVNGLVSALHFAGLLHAES